MYTYYNVIILTVIFTYLFNLLIVNVTLDLTSRNLLQVLILVID